MNFLENLRNRLCCCNPRHLRAQQVAEAARDMAMNVVNRVNDNPQQEENIVPVRYEHIVGYLRTNPNQQENQQANLPSPEEELPDTQPLNQQANLPIPEDAQPAHRPAAQPVENNNVQQPQTARAAQPVAEDELPVERSTNQPANQPVNQPAHQPGNRPVNQPINQGRSTNSQRHYSALPLSYRPGVTPQDIYPIEECIPTPRLAAELTNSYLLDHNYSRQACQALEEARMAQLRAFQPFVNSRNIPAQPFVNSSNIPAQPFVNSSNIPAQPFVNSSNIPAQPFVNSSNIPAQPFVNSRNIPAQPFVNSSNIPAFQPAAQQNNPNPIFTVRHTLGTPSYNLENAPAMSLAYSEGTHVFTGYGPNYNQSIEMDIDLNNDDRFVFRNIPKVEISRGFRHYTFDDASVVRVKRSDSIDENDGQLHIDHNGNVRAKG